MWSLFVVEYDICLYFHVVCVCVWDEELPLLWLLHGPMDHDYLPTFKV